MTCLQLLVSDDYLPGASNLFVPIVAIYSCSCDPRRNGACLLSQGQWHEEEAGCACNAKLLTSLHHHRTEGNPISSRYVA